MSIRQLIERPFRHYADFSGRSGRAEYWVLILMFVVLTEVGLADRIWRHAAGRI